MVIFDSLRATVNWRINKQHPLWYSNHTLIVAVLEFYVPPTAKVTSIQCLIQKTGDAQDQTHDSWFTRSVA